MIWGYIGGVLVVFVGISAFFGAPYVPSRRRDVRRMFDQLYPVTSADTLLDIGSGDGLVLREVSRRGAQAVGYEIHPLFVAISKLLSVGDERVRVQWVNAWTAHFPEAVTVLYIFSVGRDGKRLAAKVQREVDRLGRSLQLICYGNPLPHREPIQVFEAYYLYEFQPLHPKKA